MKEETVRRINIELKRRKYKEAKLCRDKGTVRWKDRQREIEILSQRYNETERQERE